MSGVEGDNIIGQCSKCGRPWLAGHVCGEMSAKSREALDDVVAASIVAAKHLFPDEHGEPVFVGHTTIHPPAHYQIDTSTPGWNTRYVDAVAKEHGWTRAEAQGRIADGGGGVSDRWKCCECGGRLLKDSEAQTFEWVESQSDPVFTRDLAAAFGLSFPAASNRLRALAFKGFLIRSPHFLAAGGTEYLYSVTPGWPVAAHRREAAL